MKLKSLQRPAGELCVPVDKTKTIFNIIVDF